MKYVTVAIGDVLKVAPKGAIIVVESTVSPGSIDKYVRPYVTEKGFKIGEDISCTCTGAHYLGEHDL